MRDIKTDTISPVLVIEYSPRAFSWRRVQGRGPKEELNPSGSHWKQYNDSDTIDLDT